MCKDEISMADVRIMWCVKKKGVEGTTLCTEEVKTVEKKQTTCLFCLSAKGIVQ